MTDPGVDDLLRELAPQVLGVLSRRHRDFGTCEDAVQEALLGAATNWPVDGIPGNPIGWLVTTAQRRLIEIVRNETARRRREENDALREAAPADPVSGVDDSLTLLFLCCHRELSPVSQMALTLRALGGLTTGEIARALLVPESTVGQRISRAKATIRKAGATFGPVSDDERAERLPAVLGVLYLIFNEGYAASSGDDLQRVDLTAEAIRLTRQLHASLPAEAEVTGLLALMLLTDARRAARVRADGGLVPLAEQDRAGWDAAAIAEGTALIQGVLATSEPGPYQIQAAIAAVHDEAASSADTDWAQIRGLYDALLVVAPGPIALLNRVVAIAMDEGASAGLAALDRIVGDPALDGHHRVDAVRAHLLDELGEHTAAREHYRLAAQRTLSAPEQRYLLERAARLPSG